MNNTLPNFRLEQARTPEVALEIGRAEPQPLRRNETLDLGDRAPLLGAEAVTAQVGRQIGDLMAIVQLPVRHTWVAGAGAVNDIESGDWGSRLGDSYGPTGDEMGIRLGATKIYCFRAGNGTHGKGEYLLMGSYQIEQLRTNTYGTDNTSEIGGGILALKPGQKQLIGRDEEKNTGESRWLPSVGWDYNVLLKEDPHLWKIYQSVSRRQAQVEVNDAGHLLISGLSDSYVNNGNEMLLTAGEPLPPEYSQARALGQAGLSSAA